MKSAVETLSPTRVKLTVEVPFEELKSSLDAAYREIAKQVKIPGFRPGRVPPRIIDQRVGRGLVLQEALQHAVPELYGEALRTNDVTALGQPDLDVTEIADGDRLAFTAEVDIRPPVELPAYDALEATVDDATVTEEQLAEQLERMRDRHATLSTVDRPAQRGDFVSIDLAATIDDEPVPGGETTGLSYEVGSDELVAGLDESLVGMSDGESTQFDSELVAGEHAGRAARVSVTVRSVKEKELPELDDSFAAMASEFDTIAELREDNRQRLTRLRRLGQAMEARDKVLKALIDAVDVPIPDRLLDAEIEWRRQQEDQHLESAGLTRDDWLREEGQTAEEHDAEIRSQARESLAGQLVLDAIADKEAITVEEADLTQLILRRAAQAGVDPQAYANAIVEGGRLGAVAAEARRAKALALVLNAASIKDSAGNAIDLDRRGDDLPSVATVD